MVDPIAVGLYQAMRAGGGPTVPVRAGQVDAAGPGLNGVPQPTDSLPKMIGVFQRMGFTARRDGHDDGLCRLAAHPLKLKTLLTRTYV